MVRDEGIIEGVEVEGGVEVESEAEMESEAGY